MGTRSRIGLEMTDGSILSVYSHWDGYPEGVGKDLVKHYNSHDKASELIDGGDMSYPYTKQTWGSLLDKTKERKVPAPQYYSERGEDCPPRLDKNLDEFITNGEEYGYVFSKGQWVCYNTRDWDEDYRKVLKIPH
jgi:hypothetical protein